MLQKLTIENYVLIHKLDVEFMPGFSVITGETGSGKSILLGALGLILGQRADTGTLLEKSKKCFVEGSFFIKDYQLEPFFRDHDLDYEDTLLLRREINPTGKSRAFINDSPVSLSSLKELADKLVNIHSQHSIVTLNEADFQLAVLDNYAGTQIPLQNYKNGFLSLMGLRKQKEEVASEIHKIKTDSDYDHFLADELNKADLKPNELTAIEERLQLLTHAEEIKTTLLRSIHSISSGEVNILSLLSDTLNTLPSISKYHPQIPDFIERLRINSIDIKDIATELTAIENQVEIDQEEIEKLTLRLNLLYRLLHKHQKTSVDALIELKQELEHKFSDADTLELQLDNLTLEIQKLENSLFQQATTISASRTQAIPRFNEEITRLLVLLGMNQAQFKIELTMGNTLTHDGLDKVIFLFNANKGIELDEVSRIASGGELSRLMLAVKSMISKKNLLPTIFFDEIDTGVSGEIAGKVGAILKQMGEHMQVIAITHLPQIAVKGNHHYFVYKNDNQNITTTYIKRLSMEGRIEEIAKMLSNNKATPIAIENAKELLNN